MKANLLNKKHTMAHVMNSTLRVVSIALLMLMIASVPAIEGNSGGKHNQASAGCTCHSNAGGVTVGENFPSSYNAGQSYPITIDVNGGTQAFIGGFSLQIDKGTLGNPSPDVQIAGMSATHTNSNQRSFTLDWIAPAANSGTVSVDIAVLNGNGNFQNSGDGWAKTSLTITEIPPLNTPPTASNLALSPRGAVAVDQDLTVSYTFADPDGDAESNTMVRWFVNGTLAPAYNDMTTIAASETSIEETWTVKVTPSDGMDFGPEETCQDQAMIVDIDTDGDGVFDGDDAFPNDASETSDSDGDGVGDNADAFPNDASETMDSDSDGVGDNADAFPNDATETMDSDSDGVGDNADAFPNDANETMDSDSDGVGNNADAFPEDANETMDSDMDGVGDNTDWAPNDASETMDSDGDSVGDNADVFPNDATETVDSDNDGVGDNADWAPNDAAETLDSDGDGVGDNADAFPNDASETLDSDGNGVGDNAQAAQEAADAEAAEARRNMIIIALVVLALIGGGGAVLFLRRGGNEEEPEKSFEQQSIVAAQPVIASQPVAVAAVAATPVVAAVQPVAEEPTVLRQWTDEAGYTWRAMSDGGNYWWTGTEWKRV